MSEAALKRRRGGIRSTVTGDINKVNPILDGTTAMDQAKLRTVKARLQHNLDRIYSLDAEIQSTLADDALDSEVNDSELYNDNVLTHIAKIDVALTPPPQPAPVASTAGPSASASSVPINPSVPNFKLPKFEMSTFGGDPMEWQSFWDVYKTAIHENTNIKPAEKFSYLLGYLTDEARDLAKLYRVTEANYDEVIAALKERYGDKQRAQFAHFQALVAIQPAKSNNFNDVQKVFNQCELHVRSLVALEIEEEQFAVAFVPIIMSKLPPALTTKLCEKNGTDQWTLKHLREWIKADLRAREMRRSSSNSQFSGSNSQDSGKSQQKTDYSTHSGRNMSASSLPVPSGRSQGPDTSYSGRGSQQTANMSPCIFCSESGHYHSNCPSFNTAEDRIRILEDKDIPVCFVCFRSSQYNHDCRVKFKPCYWCNRIGHHQSLCQEKYGCPARDGEYSGSASERSRSNSFSSSPGEPSQDYGDDELSAEPKQTAATVAVSQQDDDDVHDFALLQTATIKAQSESGDKTSSGRALMDIGSSRTYITESFRRRLGLRPIGSTYISVGTFGSGKRSTMEVKRVRFDIVCKDGSIQPVLANVSSVITCPVARNPIDPSQYPVINDVSLAEPQNTVSDNLAIDILIGSDQYYNFVSTSGAISCDQLVLVRSRLGYLTAGVVPTQPTNDGSPESTLCLLNSEVTTSPPRKFANLYTASKLERIEIEPIQVEDVENEVKTSEDFEPKTISHYRKSKRLILGASTNPRKFLSTSVSRHYGLALVLFSIVLLCLSVVLLLPLHGPFRPVRTQGSFQPRQGSFRPSRSASNCFQRRPVCQVQQGYSSPPKQAAPGSRSSFEARRPRPRSKSPLIDFKSQKGYSSPPKQSARSYRSYNDDRRSTYNDRRHSPRYSGNATRTVRRRSPSPDRRHTRWAPSSSRYHGTSSDRRSRSPLRRPSSVVTVRCDQRSLIPETLNDGPPPEASYSGRPDDRGKCNLDDDDRHWKRQTGHSTRKCH